MSCDVAGIFSLCISFPLPQTSDPGSYNCLPHGIVVNLAAFFELWDAFALHWVKSTQVALSDDDMHDVSRLSTVPLWKLRDCVQNTISSFRDHEINCSASVCVQNMPNQ